LRLDLRGVRVTELNVDPFEMVVTVVFIDCTLPLMPLYGRAEESVTEIPKIEEINN
jgi:hypothetical protein